MGKMKDYVRELWTRQQEESGQVVDEAAIASRLEGFAVPPVFNDTAWWYLCGLTFNFEDTPDEQQITVQELYRAMKGCLMSLDGVNVEDGNPIFFTAEEFELMPALLN